MPADSRELLSARAITHTFGHVTVLQAVDVSVRAGRILLVAGPNGAGKSTLLSILAGLSRPESGTVTLAESLPDDGEGAIGMLAHSTWNQRDMTAFECLDFWARLWKMDPESRDEAAIVRVLQRVGLVRAAHAPVRTFSRGMDQRLALARMILTAPRIWLLDEPDSGLDGAATRLLTDEICTARDGGAGIVWVSHHVRRDMLHADTVLELEVGGVGYSGPAHGYEPAEAVC